jgi:hypothetical protein
LLSAFVETKLNVGLFNGAVVTTEVTWYQCSEKMSVMKMVSRMVCEIETDLLVAGHTFRYIVSNLIFCLVYIVR